jgi:hypothetical protein
MSASFQATFVRLRDILKKHAAGLTVARDSAGQYSLEAPIGPETIRAWGGKAKKPAIAVAWVQIGKAYVSYHLMGVYGMPALLNTCSKELRARMQGKSCFNFKEIDEELLQELERLTKQSIDGMRKAGFIAGL